MLVLLSMLAVGLLGSALLSSNEGEEDDAESGEALNADKDVRSEDASITDDQVGNVDHGLMDGRDGPRAMEKNHLVGGEGNDTILMGDNDVGYGGGGTDRFEILSDGVAYIQDYQQDDLIVVSYIGYEPKIAFDVTDNGLSIIADGRVIAILHEVYRIDNDSILLTPTSET